MLVYLLKSSWLSAQNMTKKLWSTASKHSFRTNDSRIDDFSQFGELDEQDMPNTKIFIICIYCSLLIGIVFNLMVAVKVLHILYHLHRYKSQPSRGVRNSGRLVHTFVYILALSCVDATLLLNVPFMVTHFLVNDWIFGEFLCKVHLSIDGINKIASTFILTALSFDRYLLVCHSTRFAWWSQVKTTVIVLIFSLFVAALLSSPYYTQALVIPLIVPPTNKTVIKCLFLQTIANPSDDVDYNIFAIFGLGYCVPLLLMTYFYFSIVCQMYKVSKKLDQRIEMNRRYSGKERSSTIVSLSADVGEHLSVTQANVASSTNDLVNLQSLKRHSRNWNVTKRVCVLVIFYFCCWTPYWICQLYVNFRVETSESSEKRWFPELVLAFHILVYFNSAINPLLYAFLNRQLRRQCLSIRRRQRMRQRGTSDCDKQTDKVAYTEENYENALQVVSRRRNKLSNEEITLSNLIENKSNGTLRDTNCKNIARERLATDSSTSSCSRNQSKKFPFKINIFNFGKKRAVLQTDSPLLTVITAPGVLLTSSDSSPDSVHL